MPVHAFADESRRGSVYFVAAAIAQPAHLRELRRGLRGLLLRGQRELHFKKEKERRQRELAAAICRLPVEVHVYQSSCERNEEPARQACIGRLTQDLLDRGAHRLVIDSRANRDPNDESTIHHVIGQHPHSVPLVYEHLNSTSEPLLWVADSAAWCFNAGGSWRQRIDTIVGAVIDLDCP
jgi:hypothetical protein